VLLFDPGAITRETAKMLTGSGIRLVSEGAVMPESAAAGPSRGGLLRGAGGVHATSAHLRQPPTSSPRLDAILLQDQLKREMRERQARYTGICPVRERIYAVVFDELIASVTRDQTKRGNLLRRVYAESRMTIDAYKSVFEASIQFGSQKLTQGTARKGDLAEQIEGLEGEIAGLKKEVAHLESLCEGLAFREAEKAKEYEETAKEIIDLQAEQQQLQDLLVTLRPSKPEKGK
jgi:dynein light intermediate chain, axonemal